MMRKVTPEGMSLAKRILKKISFRPLPTFFSAYVLLLLQPESWFTPSPARLPSGRQAFFSGLRTYPDSIRILGRQVFSSTA